MRDNIVLSAYHSRIKILACQFDYDTFQRRYNDMAVPLFLIDKNGNLKVFTVDNPPKPQRNQKLISIIKPVEEDKTGDT